MNKASETQLPTSLIDVSKPACFSVGGLHLLPNSRQAFVNLEPLHVTGLEYNLLALLIEYSPHVVARETIADQLFGGNSVQHQQSICTHVSNLRKKLNNQISHSLVQILSVRGQGYTLISSNTSN